MTYRILSVLLLGLLSTLVNAASWNLPSGYYMPAKMPLTLVFPRPDSETNSWARNRIAYADDIMQYRIPIVIQGGAYPFHFQLVNAPPGMKIGENYGDIDYGIVTWTPAAEGGPYHVDVKVTDQDGMSLDATWSITADNSKFIFVDPKSTTNGPAGSKSQPFNTMRGLGVANTSNTRSPYAGKAIIFRAGKTPLAGPDADGNYTINSRDENPAVFLGYTGDIQQGQIPEIDMSTGAIFNNGYDDTYFGQLKLSNAAANGRNTGGEQDTVMYFENGVTKRTTFFENTFYGLQWFTGAGSGSNQGAIVTFNAGRYRQYFSVIDNTVDNFNTALIDMYSTEYIVVAGNKMLTGTESNQAGIWVKSDIRNASIRNNQSLSKRYAAGAVSVLLQDLGLGNDQIEICYNTLLGEAGKNELWYADYGISGGGSSPRIYVYRNTVLGITDAGDSRPYTAWIENNVFENSTALTFNSGTNRVINSKENLVGKLPDQIYFDADGNLVGAASQYLGMRGHEIYNGGHPLSAPSWH